MGRLSNISGKEAVKRRKKEEGSAEVGAYLRWGIMPNSIRPPCDGGELNPYVLVKIFEFFGYIFDRQSMIQSLFYKFPIIKN